MFRKSLLVQFALFFSLALIGLGASAGRGVNPQPLANPSSTQTDCSDAAIRAQVIKKLKEKFTSQKRAENFRFDVLSQDKVVTLKGHVGRNLRTSVLKNVRQTLDQMNCGAKLNPEHNKPAQGGRKDPKKDGIFLNHKQGSCPEGQEECFDGSCKARGTCGENPLLG